jgi:subtilisin-like proprotein convertase family protein
MKRFAAFVLCTLACTSPAQVTYTFNPNLAIPDDSGTTGATDTRNVSGAPTQIADLNVTLNISSQWNGDLYVYLFHNNVTAVLLNRVGKTSADALGYDDLGFNVKIDDDAANGDIHVYRRVVCGSDSSTCLGNDPLGSGANSAYSLWKPDARTTAPASVLDSDTRTSFLSAFNGMDANGDWTLKLYDFNSGATSTANSWSLEITAVPEPASGVVAALACLATAAVLQSRKSRHKLAP